MMSSHFLASSSTPSLLSLLHDPVVLAAILFLTALAVAEGVYLGMSPRWRNGKH